ncbi:SDR family oxidoreductase [Variovorax sp. J22G73]|jgi:NAD(P)-dependent dehydrogenase (short-subunit alcohol dehydrogenase family)|uniref:SDR family oxidoreductase n=1 Tax=unclassified Variovorax TaxID=663243 RepID=UPI000D5CB02F|nr:MULTISPECIES: SDR family oxidoreductase [unclassified Variovorax]MDM0009773.1 SDR family oxidoreductase [Variovorax sp. J22R203]MDM0102281.1 SDR family oxidoreductase [Variovorax sp. J22G73]
MKIKDSVVFITGANRGLGLAFAKAALAAGARKVYGAARDPNSITLAGVTPVALDVTQPAQIEAAARACGDVTLLVNNAGISRGSSFLGSPDAVAAARAELETNFFGPWAVTQAFAPVLAANGGGAVLNALSVLSWATFPSVATYCASKSAAWSLSNGLRNELAGQGTQVTSLHMALMDTDMARNVPGDKVSPDDVARQALEGVEAGQIEVLADDTSRHVKQGLSSATPPYASAPG